MTLAEVPQPAVALVLLEGALPTGASPSPECAHELVVVCPGAVALSWWVAAEVDWTKVQDLDAMDACRAARFATAVEAATGLMAAVAGLRVVAVASRETEAYLHRLFSAIGMAVPFTLEEFTDVLREFGASPRSCANIVGETEAAASLHPVFGARLGMTQFRNVMRRAARPATAKEKRRAVG